MFVSIRGRSRQIRQKLYDFPGELLKQRGLTNGYESMRISYEAYDYLTISVANFL